MNGKNYLVAVLLCSMILALTFIQNSGSQASKQYDPWMDINDDGRIDMRDITQLCLNFMATGDPAKPVIVGGYNWSVYSNCIIIPPDSGGGIEIPVIGYRRVSINFNTNLSFPLGSDSMQIRTGFKVNDIVAYQDWFSIIPSGSSQYHFHSPNSTWIEPSTINLLNPQLGQKFNVTVWASTSEEVFSWQVCLRFDNKYLKVSKVGLTAGVTSELFKGKRTVWNKDVSNDEGYVVVGEALYNPADACVANNTLYWAEFQLLGKPENSTTSIQIEKPYTNTFILNPQVIDVKPLYTFDSNIGILYNPTKTYDIQGKSLIIEYYNPNDVSVELKVEAYLTT